ncbi:MAG: hypothetical protein AAB935_00630, partial [Patescibacteria group bacterium]
MNTPEDMRELEEQLAALKEHFRDAFEEERRNVGSTHPIKNDIIDLSKRGITALQNGRSDDANLLYRQITERWFHLLRHKIPGHQRHFFLAEAGKEMMEFLFVEHFYACLFFGKKAYIKDLFLEEISAQIYLDGLTDAVSELGNILENYLASNNLPREKRMELRRRFVLIAGLIYQTLLGQFTQ